MDQQDHDDIMDASVTSEMAAGHNDSVTNHLELASTPPFQDPVFPPPHGARSPSPTAPLTPELVVDIEEKGQESGEEGKKFYNIDHVRPILADNSLDCQTFLSKLQQLNLGGDFDQFIKFDDNWRVSQVSSEAIFKVCGNFIGTNVLETLKCNDGETFSGSDEPSRGLSLDRPKLGIFYDPEMMKHKEEVDTNKDHPECPARIQRIFKVIKANGVLDRSEVRRLPRGRRLRKEESNLVHNPSHWMTLMDSRNLEIEERNSWAKSLNSIFLNQDSVDCGLLSAGGVLTCTEAVVRGHTRSALAVVRPPGHHAEPDEPHGFCLFNNVAIAARFAIQNLGLKRVLVLDWDIHHGNGIQRMFYNDPNVLYISLHRYDNGTYFPHSEDADHDKVGEAEGIGFNVNIPWNTRNNRPMGDAEYFLAFQTIILPISHEFQPELVLVAAGFDAAAGDPLGGYKVTPGMYGLMTHQLAALAGGRVVVALEGGYNLASISESATACAKALLGDPLPPVQVVSSFLVIVL